MTTTPPSHDDIIELQTRLSFLEDAFDQLSAVIARQDRQLMDLQDQLKLIYAQMTTKEDAGVAPFDLIADRPPHF